MLGREGGKEKGGNRGEMEREMKFQNDRLAISH